MGLAKILELCCKHGYFCKTNAVDTFKLGPTGSLLQEKLRNQWFNSMVTNRDCSVFYNANSFGDGFNYAKDISSCYLPFGVAETISIEKVENADNFSQRISGNETHLRCTMFVSPFESIQFFHQWQRQRRMWWRKFSAMPGRYSLTDIQCDEEGGQNVKITAEYAWGTQLVETISIHAKAHPQLTSEDLQTKAAQKKVQAHYVSSNVCLETMIVNTVCDAYEEPIFKGEAKPVLRFHRKIAPYQISFAVYVSTKEITEELTQLALYLCKKLRANNVSVLLLPSGSRPSLQAQYRHYDELGIPYTVLLNESTLKNGIAHLRSRDTTLKEQVHVSDLPTYVDQLFKNY